MICILNNAVEKPSRCGQRQGHVERRRDCQLSIDYSQRGLWPRSSRLHGFSGSRIYYCAILGEHTDRFEEHNSEDCPAGFLVVDPAVAHLFLFGPSGGIIHIFCLGGMLVLKHEFYVIFIKCPLLIGSVDFVSSQTANGRYQPQRRHAQFHIDRQPQSRFGLRGRRAGSRRLR